MNVIRRQHRYGIRSGKPLGLHEPIKIGGLVISQGYIPTRLSHDHAAANLLSICEELAEANDGHGNLVSSLECRGLCRIAVGSLVGTFDQVTRFLEFNRQKE